MVLLEGYMAVCGGFRAQRRPGSQPPSIAPTITCLNDIRSPHHLTHHLPSSHSLLSLFTTYSPLTSQPAHTSSHYAICLHTSSTPVSIHPISRLDAHLHISPHVRWADNHSSETISQVQMEADGVSTECTWLLKDQE
jgi:hypothetical protein